MSEARFVTANMEITELVIPEFGTQSPIRLDVSKIKDGESRLHEAQVVNPATYSNLEYVFNEGYREAKRHISLIGYQITLAEKAQREAKSRALIDEYPVFLKEKGFKDNAQLREAYLERVPDYVAAQDRVDMLRAMEELMSGKVHVFENTCRYLKKQMDLIIRSGVDSNKYLK